MAVRELTARMQRSRAHIDISQGRGLEVGPLFTPLVHRDEADVRYVDITSGADLRHHYREDPNVNIDDIVDVDYVLIQDGGVLPISEAAAPGGPYDWICASHVIEHVPDLVAWLGDLAKLLADGGRLSLVVPDRRFCFDVLRPATTVGDVLLAHRAGDTRPSDRAVFDHFATHVEVPAHELWQGVSAAGAPRTYGVDLAWGQVLKSETGEYIDSHVWLFTPESFADQLDVLSHLGLHEFRFVGLQSTPENELEFYATLERLPRSLSPEARRAAFAETFAAARTAAELVRQPGPVAAPAAEAPVAPPEPVVPLEIPTLVPTPRELRLLGAKRAVVNRVKRAASRRRA